MKLKLVAVAVTSMLAAGVVNAAEIYNKDGNKLDLYGKVTGLHYFSDDTDNDGDKTYVRLGFKGETQINDQLSGYGQSASGNMSSKATVLNHRALTATKPVWPSRV